MAVTQSRRERKKRQTRARIQETAIELFAKRGYRDTTIAAIADSADVAARTVTLHFPNKQDLLFASDPFALGTLRDRIRTRAPGRESTLDVLRDWLVDTATELNHEGQAAQKRFWRTRGLRARVIDADESLRARSRAGYYDFEMVVAAGIGEDLDLDPTAMAPRLAATVAIAGLREIYVTREMGGPRSSPSTTEILVLIDRVLAFIRAGITAIAAPD